ncbi:uncharacterized protein LOC119370474 [Jatropha curcas]|uniref:uncharacterized protein LOC119370474 n=1 Tax=Jatropha curcas TaxID=180498 RepID=UPI0018943391|nr:uncharacterized protein LOC119370474 [Jatropha curcas]
MQTCDRCNEPHGVGEWMLDPANPQTLEQVNYVMNQQRRNYPYSNPYDNRLRNHPNLSYGNSNNTLNAPPGFLPPEKKSHDDLLTALSKSHMDFMNETREHNKIQQAAIRNLEIQMGQFANMMAARPQGTLPSNTEKNPKEQVQAITLRSGRELEDKPAITLRSGRELEDNSRKEKKKEKEEEKKAPIIDLVEKEEVKPYIPPIPFPQRLKKTQDDQSFMKFLDVFKKLQINIPFAEALAQMPSYAKFLKEILSKKRKIDDQGMVKLTEECSAIIQNKLPPKLKDLGSFSIPCNIGNLNFEKALADLGASINLMSYEVFKMLGMGELKPTRMSLQLADRLIKYPKGIIEDVLVKIGKFIFPIDFVILDIDEGREGSLILGRPFLATARALIDVHDGKLTLRVGQEEVVFDVLKSCKLPMDCDDCFRIDVIDTCVEKTLYSVENNNTEEKEDTPKQELKQLPPHLKHAFLGVNNSFPVIISSHLTLDQEEGLLQVLRKHKKAIGGGRLSDLTRIRPEVMHALRSNGRQYKPSNRALQTIEIQNL